MFGDQEERVTSLTTNRISTILAVEDQVKLLGNLRSMHRLIESNSPLTIEQRIGPGKRVRVNSGSLMGVEGIVTARRAKMRLIVAVEFLQNGVSIEIDDYLLDPI